MAPEQTGRMNRSVDPRSDLYSLGVTLYELLVGTLPFTASDQMELIHCHIARSPPAPKIQVSEIPEQLSAIVMKLLANEVLLVVWQMRSPLRLRLAVQAA
jgi:serine/threonine protein kinase